MNCVYIRIMVCSAAGDLLMMIIIIDTREVFALREKEKVNITLHKFERSRTVVPNIVLLAYHQI